MKDVRSILDAVAGRLRPSIPELKSVELYQGDMERVLQRTTLLPAVLLVYLGAHPDMAESRALNVVTVTGVIGALLLYKNVSGVKDVAADVLDLAPRMRHALHGMRHEEIVLMWSGEAIERVTETGIVIFGQQYKYGDFLEREE